jgi:hypothetical protein
MTSNHAVEPGHPLLPETQAPLTFSSWTWSVIVLNSLGSCPPFPGFYHAAVVEIHDAVVPSVVALAVKHDIEHYLPAVGCAGGSSLMQEI